MKKIIFVFLFLLTAINLWGQDTYRYKVGLNFELQNTTSGNGYFSITPYNNSAPLQFSPPFYEMYINSFSTQSLEKDEVVEYTREINRFRIVSSNSGGTFCDESYFINYMGCFTSPGDFLSGGTDLCHFLSQAPFSYVAQIPLRGEFKDFNERRGLNLEINDCETKTIATSTGACLLQYSVIAIYQSSGTEVTTEILPYALRNSVFGLTTSMITNLPEEVDVFQIQVIYVDKENPTEEEVSDPLTFDRNPCPIGLDSTPEGISPQCYNGSDGGFNITFDRALEASEEMQINIYEETDLSAPSSDETITGPGRTFQIRSLTPGNYEIAWILGGEQSPNVPVRIPNLTQVAFTPTPIKTTCENTSDGQINITPTGGTPPYSINITENVGTINNTIYTISDLPVGTYTVSITDNNSCTSNEQTITIESNSSTPILDLGSTIVNQLNEAPLNTASITLGLITGGNGTNTYRWTRTPDNGFGVQTSQNINNLNAGEYNLEISSGGCTSIPYSFTINPPPALSVSISASGEINCENDTTTLNALAINGSGTGYTYEWFNGSSVSDPQLSETSSAITVTQGIYTVRVTDSNTDQDTFTYTLNYTNRNNGNVILEALSVSASKTDILCRGENTGIITLNISGGTGNYEVFWDGSLTSGPTNNTSLATGSHTYEVRDGNCVFQGTPIFIDEPLTNLSFTNPIAKTDVTTVGGSDGSIVIQVEGGTPSFVYEWLKDGNPFTPSSGANPIDLEKGDYVITIRDNNGNTNSCELTSGVITIGEPLPLSILNPEANVSPVLCFGASTGRIQANYQGTAPFTFTWFDGNGNQLKSGEDDFIENIPSGNYTFSINDASNAGPILSNVIVVSQPTNDISALVTPTPTCEGENNGTITITGASGGTPGYTYSIDITDDNSFQNSPLFENLSAGTYTVRVRDSNDCDFVTPNIEVTLFPDIIWDEPNTQVTNVSVPGASDGSILPIFSGGNPPFTYNWTGPNTNNETTQNLTGKLEGIYTVTVTDQNDCLLIQNITIGSQDELIVNATLNESILCYGDNSGEVTLNITGGLSPYTIEWFQNNNGNVVSLTETSNTLSDLSDGEYFAQVTDNNGVNRTSNTITITEPQQLNINYDKVDILCQGMSTGAITTNVSGGTPPYRYYWNNIERTRNLTGIPPGDYYFEVFDVNGCRAEENITINPAENPLEISNEIITNVSSYLGNDASISLEISGGAAPIDISWTKLSDNSFAESSATISNLEAGIYQVSITDTNLCPINRTYEITQPDIVEETINHPTCTGESNGSISLNVNQGNGTFTYDWSNGATTSSLQNLEAGIYQVTVTGLPNGPVTRSYTLLDPPPLTIELGDNRVLCMGQTLELDATILDENATYNWTSNNGFNSSNSNITISNTGNYNLIITSSSGCTVEDSISITVSNTEISAELATSSQIFVNETSVAVDISFPLPDTVEWILPNEATITNQNNDEVEFLFSEPGEYEIGIITTIEDCIATQVKNVVVLDTDVSIDKNRESNNGKVIEDFIVYPNPTSGAFTVDINLSAVGNVSIKVFSFANNALIATEKDRGKSTYNVPFDLSHLPTGIYAVVLETPYGNSLRKIIIE